MQTDIDRQKLDSLTGLRYWAAMLIFAQHVLNAALGTQSAVFGRTGIPRPDLASIAMPLFFTLSGFLMWYNYGERFQKSFRATLRDFLAARFARIYPLYLFALVASFSTVQSFFHDLRDSPGEVVYCQSFMLTLTQAWFHQPVFVDQVVPRSLSLAYLGVAWSVSVEVFFYVTFPFLCLPLMRRMTSLRRIAVAAIFVFVAYAAFDLLVGSMYRMETGGHPVFRHRSWPGWLLYISPYTRYGEFLIGCLAGGLFARLSKTAPSPSETLVGHLVLLGSLAVLSGISFVPADLHDRWALYCLRQNILNAPLCAALILCLARYRSLLGALLQRPLFVLLGESSYGIYLLHPIVQSLYQQRTQGEMEMTDLPPILFNHAVMIAVLHVFCLGCFQFIEAPARVKIRSWLSGRRSADMPLAAPVAQRHPAPRIAA